MDSNSFNFHNIKLEKAKKMLKYRRLQKVTTLFRLIEACLLLIILSRSSSALILPIFTLKISAEYFKGIFSSLIRPGSVFIIGNLIIMILFFKSGHSSSAHQEGLDTNSNKIDLYDEYIQSCERNLLTVRVAEAKKMVSAAAREAVHDQGNGKNNLKLKEKKSIRRIRSETLMNKMHKGDTNNNNKRPEMKRSVTEKCLKSAEKRGMEMVKSPAVDKMSNEEFRSRVEAFIARQQKILREEIEI